MIQLIQGDCLIEMQKIKSGSVDAIITDPPYGTTACKWDSVIPFDLMWEQLHRITKPNGAVVLTASQPFCSALIMSNVENFRYDIVWEKDRPTNPLVANIRVMPRHESILVFYKKQPTYNPQKSPRSESNKRNNKKDTRHKTGTKVGKMNVSDGGSALVHPSSVQKFTSGKRGFHPTQKPVALMEYLIKTYTNENETVLDFTMGSGTTGVAAKNLNRSFIGIEQDPNYFKIAEERINKPDLFTLDTK